MTTEEKRTVNPAVKKTLSKIGDILRLVILFVSAAVLIFFLVCGIFKIRMYDVYNQSMEPTIKKHSLILVKQVYPETIKDGDIITFTAADGSLTTSRVIETDRLTGVLVTRSDAAAEEDVMNVPFERVLGRMVYQMPLIGAIFGFMSTSDNHMLVIALIAILVIFSLILEVIKRMKRNRAQIAENDQILRKKFEQRITSQFKKED